MDPYVYGDVPETEPLSISFERTGFESTLMISNISFIIWVYFLHGSIFVLVYLQSWLLSSRSPRAGKVHKRLKEYYFWGGLLVMLMETF